MPRDRFDETVAVWLFEPSVPDHHYRTRGTRRVGLFGADPELQTALADHLEETASSLNRSITGWLDQSVARRTEMQGLLQQFEDVKQLAELLSRQWKTSHDKSGPRGGESASPPSGAKATGMR